MKKILFTLFALFMIAGQGWATCPNQQPFCPLVKGAINITGNITQGQSSIDDVQPTFSIIGDADSDAGATTSDTFSLVLTPAAAPTGAYWDFDSTQTLGMRFLKRVDILTTTADNKYAMNISQTANSGSGVGINITSDFQHGNQGLGIDANISSTGSAAVTDDIKGVKSTAKYERTVSFATPRMVDGHFGQALWNVNSTNAVTGAHLNGFHVSSGLGFDSGDVTNMDTVTDLSGILIEKTNFFPGSVASAIVTFTNYRGIWIKDTAFPATLWTGDADAVDITNLYGIHIEDQTLGITNTYGIVLDDGSECVWMDGTSGTALCSETTTISSAQIQALAATPITIAKAHSGAWLEPVSVVLILDFGTVAYDDAAADGNLIIQYATSNTAIAAAIEADGFIDSAADIGRYLGGATNFTYPAITDDITSVDGEGLEIINDGAEFTVVGGGDGVMDVKVTYYLHVMGL